MQSTTLLGLSKPIGSESFSRSILNTNSDLMDKNAVVMALCAAYYGTLTKGAMVFNGSGQPQSQTITGPNGLTGSMTWSFTSSTITETLSITAPVAFSMVKTVTIATLAETWTIT